MFKDYCVWYRRFDERVWKQTLHGLRARTDNEAQSRLRRQFAGADFSSMSLMAVEVGKVPPVVARDPAA